MIDKIFSGKYQLKWHAQLMIGKIFSGKYQLKQEIGRGGMGVVYEALHMALNRTVAIKVLHSQFTGDPTFLKRFQREARAMARLDHGNIIRVFDVAEEGGTHYIVMEYFPGKDLKHLLIGEKGLTPKESVSITLQVSNALSYAHAHGIIHRDIKPANIMVDDAGVVKIADFGIAAATDEVSVTTTGHIVGTPEYMSAEQARGEDLDCRSDLYSLGMVLYEMITGQTSYPRISGMAVLGKLVYDKKEFELTFQAGISPPLQDLIKNLLKKNREHRLPNAATLAGRLANIASELGSEASQAESAIETVFAEFPIVEGRTLEARASEDSASEDESLDETVMLDPEHQGPGAVKNPHPPSTSSQAVSAKKPSPPSETIEKTVALAGRPPPPKKPLHHFKRSPFIAGAVLIVLMITGIGTYFYLSKNASITPQRTSESSLIDDVRKIQVAIREIQAELVESRKNADIAAASRWAKEAYGEAFNLENKGSKQLDEADILIQEGDYPAAKGTLQTTLSLFQQANSRFLQAKESAILRLVQSEKRAAEQEVLARKKADSEVARLKREREKAKKARQKQEALARVEREKLKQEKAQAAQRRLEQKKIKAERERLARENAKAAKERSKQEALVLAEQEKLKQEKARAEQQRLDRQKAKAERERLTRESAKAANEKERQKALAEIKRRERAELQRQRRERERAVLHNKKGVTSPAADIDLIGGILNRLKVAYEKKDLKSLQKMSNMSVERSRFLSRIFQNYKTVRVSVTDLSLAGDAAQAVISITSLTSENGSRVFPSNQWKNARLTIRKQDGSWGKVIW